MALEEGEVNLSCKDYGYDCEFESNGNTEKVLEEFSRHCTETHGIEYEKDILGNFIRRKFS